jgi:IS5 family transposase
MLFFELFFVLLLHETSKIIQMSWAGNYVEKRTRKNTFFRQINEIIDWNVVSKEIDKVYKKGQSVDGRPSYREIVLFKMMLLQTWYNLSNPQVEEMVNENLSAMRFCELELEYDVPDHSTLSRFRKELVEEKSHRSFIEKNKQAVKRQRHYD